MTLNGRIPKGRHTLLGIVAISGMALLLVVGRGAARPVVRTTEPPPDSALLQRMFDAEDARSTDPAAVGLLLEGLRSDDVETRRIATRALGRMETRANLTALEPMLTDPSPAVRVEAVNALAQMAKAEGPNGPPEGDARMRVWTSAQTLYFTLALTESDPAVRGAIARSIGRLPYPTEAIAREAAESIVALMPGPSSDGALGREPWFGVMHGIDAILRRYPNVRTSPAVIRVALLPPVPSVATTAGASDTARSRETNVILAAIRGRVLGAAVGAANGIDAASARDVVARFLTDFGDADPQVRRQVIALAGVAGALDDQARTRIVTAGLGDPSQSVRVEAVRAYARRPGASCAPLISATRDQDAHVVLAAIDALGAPCEPTAAAVERLGQLVRNLPRAATPRTGTRGSWHPSAHALVSLARVAPDSARANLPRLIAHPVWQVRMYAARAAGTLGDTATLVRLASDRADNVRDAAVGAFADLLRPAAGATAGAIARTPRIDSIFIAQLTRPDYQLVLNAARALEGAQPSARLGDALYAALDRLTAQRRETSRDPRMEILARIQGLGDRARANRLLPYLTDFDPAVAERAAGIVRATVNNTASAAPRRLGRLPTSLRDVARLRGARVRVTMAPQSGGGSFEMRLFADEAPATVSRLVASARRGYYNGLTFHREATNFVIQGGSPGANEYVGSDRFMRDEVGLRSHQRGTLGISTRGRDTGDEQIFVNTIDNWRLDHDYTVFAEIVRGMEVVDRVLEGDVIARVDVLGAR